MKHLTLILAAAVAIAACSNSSTGDAPGVPTSELTALRLPVTAPALCADSVGAWFYKTTNGDEKEIALQFPEEGDDCTGETEDFLRLRLDRRSLATLPDGTPVAIGDSVFISVKWVGSDSILFRMTPSGLRFTPGNEARLKIEYGELNGDLDEDGGHDEDDDEIETRIDIWRQEEGDSVWFSVGTVKLEDEDEIEGELRGFSRYMLAY